MLSNKTKPEKSNAPKDPDAPKRPVPAYFLFCSKERAEVQKELSSCNGAEVTKELGKRWALLDPEAKRVFEEASKKDKERYEEDMKSYKPSENFLKRKAEYETKAKLQNPLVAKQPTNPVEDYFTYLLLNWRQVHLANQGFSGRQTQEEVWKAWQAQGNTSPRTSAENNSNAKKGGKVKAAKDPLAPKKPPSAYFLFCSAKRAELAKALPDLKPKEVTVELGRMWNKLGEEEKAPYVSEATKLMKEFKEEMEKYSKNREKLVDMESLESNNDDVNMEESVHEAGDVEVNMEGANKEAEKEDPDDI